MTSSVIAGALLVSSLLFLAGIGLLLLIGLFGGGSRVESGYVAAALLLGGFLFAVIFLGARRRIRGP